MPPRLSHKGKQKRSDIIPVLGFPNYSFHRIRNRIGGRKTRKIPASARDADRKPYTVDFVVKRRLKGGWMGHRADS